MFTVARDILISPKGYIRKVFITTAAVMSSVARKMSIIAAAIQRISFIHHFIHIIPSTLHPE